MSYKVATADLALAEIASRQHGAISTRQLSEAGIDKHAVSYRVRIGRLYRIHQGVYAVGHSSLSDEARWMAAVLACGRPTPTTGAEVTTILARWGVALSHRSAACLWRLLAPKEAPVDVSIPSEGGRGRRSGIRLHRARSLRPADVTLRGGIPVTTPARTIADLRQSVRESKRLISPRELRHAIRQAEVAGLPVGSEGIGRTRSDLERDFLRLCRRHRLQTPEINVRVGSYLVDFFWRGSRLIVETDGYRYHRGEAAFQDDHRREFELKALGYEVVRLSEQQVKEESDRIAKYLRGRVEAWAAPHPDL
jgi:very-short-patch-repair endonuclease